MKLNESLSDRKKRMRRTAEEIDRHFRCTIETCLKTYGSEGSLNQHIKLKHPDHYVVYQFFYEVLSFLFGYYRHL